MKKILLLALLMINTSAFAKQDVSLMLDWFVNPDHGPIIIAQQRNLFADQGLNVTIQEPADPSLPPKLVAAGKVDIAVTYQPQLTMDVAEGLPLVRSATLIATPLNTLTVLQGKGLDSLASLKGKTIGTSLGGYEKATLGTMLETAGISFDDVKLVNVGWALSASLMSGKVDAIFGGYRNFELNQLDIEGAKAKAFFLEEHGVPPYDELIFVANSKTADLAMLAKFNRALELASQYIVNHPQQAWQEFKAYKPDTLDSELNRRAWIDTLPRFALRPSAIDPQRYQTFADFMQKKGVIKAPLNAKLLYLIP
ncbi:ABC transporter substrate-binding protein [Pelagibaculum spongiae]|uniref:ABC transporter ATP-binding protein n=1 Tax=Pelagibaculum spongiae TaxID=2080658 RepID=A0A2V1H017_9GAMM|nr:ABC transporter substrate-binding protein [Pelagibaculum spongiae]PVZ69012.1 ABC transporter ATP-binding protein [Pelagibaculum spongiae]